MQIIEIRKRKLFKEKKQTSGEGGEEELGDLAKR